MTMRLHNLQPRPGAKHRRKRLGCGDSSGHGGTSTRGGKGQTARTGGTIRLGFEGGQMPLLRRIPKRGFNHNAFRDELATVNVEALERFADGTVVTGALLMEHGLAGRLRAGVKILGGGTLTKKLTVQAQAFSASARQKIQQAGGQCEEVPRLSIRHKSKAAQ